MFIEDEELRGLYKISGEENLQKLVDGFLHLQKQSDDTETIEKLLRITHSLKGDSRIVEVEEVVSLTEQVEKILLSLKYQEIILTPQVSDRLFQGLDAIGLFIQEAVTGQSCEVDIAQILEQLMTTVVESESKQVEDLPETQLVLNPQTDQPKDVLRHISTTINFIEDEELREIYQTTSEERLQKLAAGLLHLQKQPEDEANLEQLLREVHSLKGDSRSLGIDNVVNFAHEIEKILLGIQRQEIIFTPQVSDRLLQGLDAIGFLVYEVVTGKQTGVDTTEILEQLITVVAEPKLPDTEVFSEIQPIVTTQISVDTEAEFITMPEQLGDAPRPVSTTIHFIEDEELREIYQTTSEERLQKLVAGLLHLQNQPGDEVTLQQLLREAHSLKGDSRSLGLENVVTITHQLEEILLGIKRREIFLTPQISDRFLQGLDAIGLLVQAAVTGEVCEVNTTEILEQLIESVSASVIPQFSPVPVDTPPLPTKTPVGVSQPYQIDTIRIQTCDLDALSIQTEELTLTKSAIAHTATEIEEVAILWEEWKTVANQEKYPDPSSLNSHPSIERLEKIINSLKNSIQEHSNKLDIITGELREKINHLRLLPLSTVFNLFKRVVRDLAKQQSKQVELIITGGEITADKRILEEIKDPLMHIVRNAIDHGIETPAEREKFGKPPLATIWLRGHQSGNNIAIEIADDGRGLDVDKIKQIAIKRGLYSQEELANMTPSQINALILAPGFSTQTFITEISGRGIGLDVVSTSVERLKGNIQIESTPNQGCTFHIQVSTTLAITNILLFEVQGIIHALPVEFIQRTLLISPEEISTNENRKSINLDNQTILAENLADLLEIYNSPAYTRITESEPKNNTSESKNENLQACILLKVGEEVFGLFVDRLLQTQEVVMKPQSQLLKRVRNVSGATILGSGEICMILNPSDLLKSLQQQVNIISAKPRKKIQTKPVILLVEDSIPVRTQEKRLLQKAGYEVVVAVDGLDGYNKLKTRDFAAIISDVEMPNLDGLSLTKKIRQHPEYHSLPIIMVTTLTSDEDKKRGAEAGANAYIMKSNFNQDVLLEILERFI